MSKINSTFNKIYKNSINPNFNNILRGINLLKEEDIVPPEGSVAAPAMPPPPQTELPQPVDDVGKTEYLDIIRTLLSFCLDNFKSNNREESFKIAKDIIGTSKIDATNAEALKQKVDSLMSSLNVTNQMKDFPKSIQD